MADYWKSQPRKFCEFCKCWLTENKPSIEFHEKGKRHQENVRKKIDTIKKKSLAEMKKKKEMENDMDSLNKAAIEAFKKDIINDPTLAKQYGISITKKESDSDNDIPVEKPVMQPENLAADIVSSAIASNSETQDNIVKLEEEENEIEEKKTDWYEAVSDEGYHYFWNTKTNESVWEKPDNCYSLQEQGLNEDGTEVTEEKNEVTDLKETEIKKETHEMDPDPKPSSNPKSQTTNISSSRSAYGQWKTCEKIQSVDYELPSVPKEMSLPAFSSEEPVKMKFKEKQLTLPDISDGECITFKKRKFSKGSRHIRSKIQDD